MKNTGIDEDELERIKRVMIGSNLREYNDVERIGNNFIRAFMSDINPFESNEVVQSITKKQLEERLSEHFTEEGSVLSVIEPLGEAEE